jgi:large subunit ribosomal protein L3
MSTGLRHCIRAVGRLVRTLCTQAETAARSSGPHVPPLRLLLPPPNTEPVAELYGRFVRRIGVVARKIGMLPHWDANGVYRCVTVLHIDNNHVIQVKQLPSNASNLKGLSEWSVQIGAGSMRPYQAKKPHRYHCAYAGTDVKEKLVEFRVAPAAAACIEPGTPITARHFIPGQYLDVIGTSIGKGFQGAMKRHGFGGLPASHGVSLTHRSLGATGQRQDPGRVFKGKRMPGRMGGERTTVQSLRLERVDCKRNLLFVSGPVPGHTGNWVLVRDAVKKSGLKWWAELPHLPPFPTFVADPQQQVEHEAPADWFAAPRRNVWLQEVLSARA